MPLPQAENRHILTFLVLPGVPYLCTYQIPHLAGRHVCAALHRQGLSEQRKQFLNPRDTTKSDFLHIDKSLRLKVITIGQYNNTLKLSLSPLPAGITALDLLKMLEGPVANLLNRFLGVYIRNFDPKQLNIGIWSGDVKLKNLELRREALDQLRLPINVIEGHLGQLTLSIPWANLKGRPVKVFIEDVFLLAAPKEYAEYNEEEEEKRAQAVKMEKLDSAEMLKERNVEGLSQEEKQKNQSFTDSLVTKIVDNLQVTVRNIHIRYEDSISAPGHPFALGFTLEEFSAVSTTEDWNPSYIQTSAGVTHKLATLGALAVYWNTDSPLLGAVKGSQQEKDDVAMNHEEIFKKFREMIVKGETPELGGHQFVLKPVSGLAKIILDKTGKTDRPKLKAKLQFNEIGFVLDDDQYRDALMMVDLFHYFIRHQIYKKYEPKGVTPKEDPRAWFRFAGNAVLSKIHDRNRLWSWDHFKERRDNRIRYIELYKLRKMDQPLPPSDSAELEKLEKKISYEDLRFWRSLARNQLRKEKATVKKSAAPTQKQGWIAWAWGAPKEEQKAEESTVLSDQQRKELYDAIDWNEKNALAEAVDAPKDSVKLQVEASLDTGSFTLKREPHGKNTEILSTSFDTFKANFYQRPDSFLADISLGGLRMYDGTTEGNLFKQFARVKDSPPILSDSRIRELDGDEQPVPADRESVKDAAADPFFQLQFEQRPLDESADSAITIKLKSMEIIYNPNLIVEIARFFKPPERHLESIGALMESASATVEGIRKQTRAGLEFALEEHKTINAKLDLQAPLIIIPDNVTSENANCLILDAGHVSLSSELVEKTTMKEIQAKQKKQYSEQDYTQLEGLMYDKFLLKLEATQVLIGPSIERVKKQLQNKDDTKRFHIVERINIDFVVEVSIIPKAPNITKFRISGHLPVLNASVSDMKYKTLMKLIDVAIPKFGDNSQLDTKSHAQHTKEDSKTQQPAIKPRASQRASFKFSPSQRQIISEDDDTDNESNRSIHRSKELSSDEEMSLHQRSFQLKFTVDKLQGSLSKVDPEGKKPDQLLVELVAEHFQLDFYIRPYDMVAEVLLKALNVDDHIEENPTPEFKKIVSSVGFDADASKDLFFVKYMKVNRMSPEFMDIHESIDTHIDVSISTINTIVTRRTLLTLLDFVLLTFTNQNPPTQAPKAVAASESNENSAENGLNTPAGDTNPSTDRMRVKIDLSSIVLILNNDGIRLATLSLNTANLNIFLMGKTMKIGGRLGNLSLVDEINQGASLHSPLRQLVTIQGHELADFKYETFDSNLANSYPGYSSSVYLRSGSIKVNFLEEPFRKIIEFLDKFGKMQAIFNAARQAAMNQANQIQENADKMHFDVLVKTPILVFPRVMTAGKGGRDTVTAYLGEIYANNKFVSLEDDPEVSGTINKLSAGIRNIRLTSDFFYGDGESEELEMINKVDLAFNISYLEHKIGAKRPDLEFHGSMSDIKLRISQDQLRFLLELSRSVPAAFASDPVESQRLVLEELPDITTKPAKAIATNSPNEESSPIISLGPELQSTPDTWAKLDMVFRMPSVGLELLLADGDNPIRDTEAASLSKFSLNDTKIKLRMMSDGSIASEILVNSFTIRDSRKTETNKFRKIMSSMDNNVQQFMASITISGGTERNLIAILTIDSPRIIFALDYIFALHSFINLGMTVAEPIADKIDLKESSDQLDDYHSSDSTELDTQNFHYQDNTGKKESSGTQQSAMDISFRGNIVNAQVILIANPTASHSEAIVLGTKQVMLSQQNALMLQVTKIGMFLCRMDKFETSRLRILDDFNLKMSMETKSPGSQSSLTSINIDIDPLVLRLSLRDILLALQIINKASELSGSEDSSSKEIESKKTKELKSSSLKVRSASGKGLSTKPSKTSRTINSAKSAITRMNKSNPGDLIVMKKEELTARLEGIRIILIGDLHELPLLDLSVKNFDVGVKDWTGSISGDTNIDLFVNVYNFSKSTWEPLIEPWQMGFHLARDQNPSRLSVDIYSRKMLEITATSATIALASNSAQFLSQDEDVLSKPRIADAPYRIINYTGFDLKVWTNGSDTKEAVTAKLADGEEVPWRFEESEKMREHLSPEGSAGVISAHLEDSDFDPISAISVNREGERLYILRPKRNGVLHRILVEVKLESDNVKYITLRSPLLVENHTLIPVEIGVYSPDEDNLLRIIKCPPGESRPSPIGAAFIHSLVIRPDQGFGYTWSDAPLHWKDVMKRPVRTITCKGENGERTPPFYFQMKALYNENSPLSRAYPNMRIRLSAPIELQNLLPYDFKYRIYDKHTKKDWTNFLRKGGLSPVHVVELSHLLLLSVKMQDTVFKQSEFAIINSHNNDDFRRENSLVLQDNQGLNLKLKLHYYEIPDSGGSFRVTVFSPHVILNKTGLPVNIKSKSLLQSAKYTAGQALEAHKDTAHKALPYMFSYGNDDRQNRALFKVGESNWSRPQSLEAIGSTVDVVIPSSSRESEIHIGISVDEGEGKYKLSKVVTVAPRFILVNKVGQDMEIREPGSSEVMTIKSGELLPLHFLRQSTQKQLCLCYPGLNNQWSAPFNIADLGSVHVKISRAGERQNLIRIEILMEQSTIFLHFSTETKNWPFSMRNESDVEFMFAQANPYDDEDDNGDRSNWRPIRYKLPPRSVMPYAWDYPAAKQKLLLINANGVQRQIKLAEIGNLVPMKIPPVKGAKPTKIVDLNVAADGPTQTLVVSNYRQSQSLYRQNTRAASSQASVANAFEVKEQDTNVTFKAQLRLAGIGISLINSQLKELAYITFRDLELKYNESALYQTVNVAIKWIQIDNQLYGGIFPILLYPSVVPKTGKEMDVHPSFHASATRVKDDRYGVLYIKYATILMQQMTLEIDEDFVFALLEFSKIAGASWSGQPEGKLCDDHLDIPEPKQENQGQDVYFELLNLQPAQLDLSFVRTERVNVEDKTSSRNPLMFFLNILTMAVGNVNDAPVRLNSLMLENARVSIPLLSQHIQNHYSQEFLYQVHKILGSADFLGNPVGLFNNISSGVADIFYEPYQGFVMTDRPQELGIGIAKGATSFVKKSVFGVTDSMSKVTGSISKGLTAATMDKQFQDRRRMTRSRNRPKHALYGVTAGANSFMTSVASGVGGLARKPLEGAEKEGVGGFFKGLGKGVIGLATKPAVGFFDLASNVTEGIRNTTTVFDAEGLDRVRLPRYIGIDGIVRPYTQREALGQFWLKQVDDGKFFDDDYVAHLELPREDAVVILTYTRIMLVRAKRLSSEWVVPLKDIATIRKERSGLALALRGGGSGPFVPVMEESERKFLYARIGVAVNSYNEKFRAVE